MVWELLHVKEPVNYRRSLPVSIVPRTGELPVRIAGPAPANATSTRSLADALVSTSQLQLPITRLDIAHDGSASDDSYLPPPPMARELPLQAQAVERWITLAAGEAPLAGPAFLIPPALNTNTGSPALSQAQQHRALRVSTAPVAPKPAEPDARPAHPAAAARLPELRVEAVEACTEPMRVPDMCEQWMRPLAAEPVAILVGIRAEATAHSFIPELKLRNELGITAVDACTSAPMPVPNVCEQWMPSLAAEPVAMLVEARAEAVEQCAIPELKLPTLRGIAVSNPWMPSVSRLRPPLPAEPVSMQVWPQTAAAALPIYDVLPDPAVPGVQRLQASGQTGSTPLAPAVEAPLAEAVERMALPVSASGQAQAAANVVQMPAFIRQDLEIAAHLAEHSAGLEAEPVEAMPLCAPAQPVPIAGDFALRLPEIEIAASADAQVTGLRPAISRPVEPAVVTPAARQLPIEPIRTLFVVPPQPAAAEAPEAFVAQCSFVALDFHCQRSGANPTGRMVWCAPVTQPILPGLSVHPILERLEDALPQKKKKNAAGAGVLEMPESVKRKTGNPMVGHAIKAIAACFLLGSVLWFGIGAIRIGNQTPAVNRDVSVTEVASGTAPEATPTVDHGEAPGKPFATPPAPKGPVAKLRQAISERAASTVTDSFHNGMHAWGTQSRQWAPGWSRHPDGYMQTGALALFHPSLNYKDYHMEFYGQIESKSIGWAVRAHDTQNYYAMKFTVIEPGLRPVIAMVHYPVVDGKKGKPVQIPLNVMVHNNRPMQVDVDVEGNKLLTSIDGQLVDTWIDDTLVAGGVGFFSEAGERARLYWMKISRNDDFLGRICAYVSSTLGDGSRATAALYPGDIPRSPGPLPGPEGTQEAALASVAVGLQNRMKKVRRRGEWNS